MTIIDCHVNLEGNVIPGINQNAGQVLPLLQARGIDQAVVLSSRATQVDPSSGNRILKTMLEGNAGLFGCLVVNLNRVDISIQSIRDLLGQKRFVSVLLTMTRSDDPLPPLLADEALNACRRYQKPIYVQTPNAACVEAGLALAKTYNMHKFVFLGMGGADWRTGIAAAHQSVNIFLETSGALDRAKIAAAVEGVGPHRVVFGSGLPNLDPAAGIGLINNAGISQGEQRRILYDNAYRLFNLADLEA